MSIFGGSERFPDEAGTHCVCIEHNVVPLTCKPCVGCSWCPFDASTAWNTPARSPGPIYSRPEQRAKGNVVMKADYRPVDESRKWGKRESWIGGVLAPRAMTTSDDNDAVCLYTSRCDHVHTQAPIPLICQSSRKVILMSFDGAPIRVLEMEPPDSLTSITRACVNVRFCREQAGTRTVPREHRRGARVSPEGVVPQVQPLSITERCAT